MLPPSGTDSDSVAVFNLLNQERTRCGFGALNWNNSLATAAMNHTSYLFYYNAISHFENQATNPIGFTGNTSTDRAIYAGYGSTASVDEDSSRFFQTTPFASNDATYLTRVLLSAPLHMGGMLGFVGHKDVGIAVLNSDNVTGYAWGPNRRLEVTINTAHLGTDVQGTTTVAAYPCTGTTGVIPSVNNESPNPLPGRDLSASPIGNTIFIDFKQPYTFVNATLAPTAGGASITLLNKDMNSLSSAGAYSLNGMQSTQLILIPDTPLAAATSYRYTVNVLIGGSTHTVTHTYTTQ